MVAIEMTSMTRAFAMPAGRTELLLPWFAMISDVKALFITLATMSSRMVMAECTAFLSPSFPRRG
jgi:hypothetical protein